MKTNTNSSLTVSYTHTFKEHIDKVYKCFASNETYSNVVYKKFIRDMHFEKGGKIDEEGTVFSFEWKNYYKITLQVLKSINTPYMKAFFHRSTNISELDYHFSCSYRFFWDSCEEKTTLTQAFSFDEQIVKDLFKEELTIEEMRFMCLQVEKYLHSDNLINETPNQEESVIINQSIETVWANIDLERFFLFLNHHSKYKLVYEGNHTKIAIGLTAKVSMEMNGKDIVIAKLVVKEVEIKEKRRLVQIECSPICEDKSNVIVKQLIEIHVIKYSDSLSMVVYKHKASEYVCYETIRELSKTKKEILKQFKTMLELSYGSLSMSKDSSFTASSTSLPSL